MQKGTDNSIDGIITTNTGYPSLGEPRFTWTNPYQQPYQPPGGIMQDVVDTTIQTREEVRRLKNLLSLLAEHLLMEKAKEKGLDVLKIAQLYNSKAEGDREIALSSVNDAILTKILEATQYITI